MGQINRLLSFYLIALAVLLGSVVTNLMITDQQARQLEQDAAKINISGRQRMLSQRIIYLAQDLVLTPVPDTRDALMETISEFESVIDLFAQSHMLLSGELGLDPSIGALYFNDTPEGALDTRVYRYIDLARQIAQTPTDTESLNALKEIERGGLLRDLDAVVSQIEAISVQKLDRMRQIEFASLILAVLIVAVEILLVFLPGHRLIRRAIQEVKDRNRDLEESQKRIDSKNLELRRSNDIIARERATLETALQESEALRREQAEFTYSVSHDMKSPTNTIRMVLKEIKLDQGDVLNEDSLEGLEHCEAIIQRMGAQIEDVLTYAWSTSNKEESASVDLNLCVQETLDDLAGDVAQADADIQVAELPVITCYKRQVKTLVQNLVSNALKYRTSDERPTILINSHPGPDPGSTVLSVSDNGIGIAPEHHQRIFGLFQRLHRRDEYPGSGLGLSTCQRIAQNHNGAILLKSELGKGATFSVTLRQPAHYNASEIPGVAQR